VIITHPRSITIAEGSDVRLKCEAVGEGTLNYQWVKKSATLPEILLGNESTRLIIPNITTNDSGEYYCKVDNGGTSVVSMEAQVIVKSNQMCSVVELICKLCVYTI